MITPAMRRALSKAATRERGNICPVRGVHAAAEDMLIKAMERRGFITWDGLIPRISDTARTALAGQTP